MYTGTHPFDCATDGLGPRIGGLLTDVFAQMESASTPRLRACSTVHSLLRRRRSGQPLGLAPAMRPAVGLSSLLILPLGTCHVMHSIFAAFEALGAGLGPAGSWHPSGHQPGPGHQPCEPVCRYTSSIFGFVFLNAKAVDKHKSGQTPPGSYCLCSSSKGT